jgi:hypothetical protein
MRAATKTRPKSTGWKPIPDPEGRFSSGIPDFDRLLGGGFQRGSHALYMMDETVRREDVDLLLFPTLLNILYHSRGIMTILPARDSPHDFRARLTRYVTRRRFDSRVRIMDYIGEDEGPPYVVNVAGSSLAASEDRKPSPAKREAAVAKVVKAEREVQGGRGKPFLELTAFEVFETLMGVEKALKMYYYGIKRVRGIGNLGIGLLGPGLGCAAGVRRLVDTEFSLHRDEVGLLIKGNNPSFPTCVVTPDPVAGPPHVAFVPRPI